MDILYRIFYTVFSMGIVSACLLPLVLIVRFLMRNMEKRHMLWEWRLIYLRSVCPVALSSVFCMAPAWNRMFHQFLSNIGLTIQGNNGIMTSWRLVYEEKISVSAGYRGCTYLWIFGIAMVFLGAAVYQARLRRVLGQAVLLGENIYETPFLHAPVQTGIFRRKLYLPKGFHTKDLPLLLRHMEQHKRDGVLRLFVLAILAVHWFNPVMWLYYYLWNIDMEMSRDDKTLSGSQWKDRQQYAQTVLNMERETPKSILSLVSVGERYSEKRARRLMYQKKDTPRKKLSAVFLLSVSVIIFFFLAPIRMAWDGGTWRGDTAEAEKPLFDEKENLIVAKARSSSPDGLDRVIQLEMTKGKEEDKFCRGSFDLVMYDSMDNELARYDVGEFLGGLGLTEYVFTEGMALCISDYNNDSVKEIVLGQQIEFNQKDFESAAGTTEQAVKAEDYKTYSYSLINIEDTRMSLAGEGIYAITNRTGRCESMHFDLLEGAKDIFEVPLAQKTGYYAWNEKLKTYEKRQLSRQEIQAYKNGTSEAGKAGEVKEHTLDAEDGTTKILVTTKNDRSGTAEIQSVILSPRKGSKKLEDIRGYFCDLWWLDSQQEPRRYAVLLYNGTKSQTFVIYDTEKKRVYFAQEDGNEKLAGLFRQRNADDVAFARDGAVLYNVTQKQGDVLTITFAASAEDGAAVNGQYEYNVRKRKAGSLTYDRSVESTAEPE